MSFEAINLQYAGKRDPVHISIRRRATKQGRSRVVLSVKMPIWQKIGLDVGDRAIALIGKDMDRGKLRIEPAGVGKGAFIQAVKTGKGNQISRGCLWINPWMDLRGIESLSSMPCRFDIKDGGLVVELPRELTDLPQLKVVV